jgi:DNA repair photolyase
VLVKVNAVDLLADELARKRVKGLIGTGSMNDPYGPVEKSRRLTGRALEVIARFRFPVHVLTKSDLVLRDVDTLQQISDVHALVSFSVTTADDKLARKVEPGAPRPSRRFAAMRKLAKRGILTGVLLMPLLPFIQDNEETIRQIVEQAADSGASYIIPAFGMTLRDRQRAYYYDALDREFPGLRKQYEHTFGEAYHCRAQGADRLYELFYELCEWYAIRTRVIPYVPEPEARQLSFF